MNGRHPEKLGVPHDCVKAAIGAIQSIVVLGRLKGKNLKQRIGQVLDTPEDYLHDPHFGSFAHALIEDRAFVRPDPVAYRTWGERGIDKASHLQMRQACRVPVARRGALMPDAGSYVALLSHSGSRGVGAAVCSTYSNIAGSRLPRKYHDLAQLAWLDMDSEAGQEYWAAMNLMGDYAAANHDVIHKSASHGAGRRMSRRQARAQYTWTAVKNDLARRGIQVLSAGADEVPGVHKNIEAVMREQTDLVEIVARFDPTIVKMCGDGSRLED